MALDLLPRVLSVAWGPLELGLMSVTKLQVSLVRHVWFTMLESLPLCLFMDYERSRSQIPTHGEVYELYEYTCKVERS